MQKAKRASSKSFNVAVLHTIEAMKILFLLLLLLVSVKANAEITSRSMKIACGTDSELRLTLKNYKEMPVIFSYNTNANYVYSLFVNF